MTTHAPEHWFDAMKELDAFWAALWTATEIFRKAHPGTPFAEGHALLWRLIEEHDGVHDRGTWLRIETVLPGEPYVVIRQRQSDGTDQIFNLTAVESRELIGWPTQVAEAWS